MLPRFLLSRGGVSALQLQRLLLAAPPRTSVLGGARVLGGNIAIGRLSISPVAVRYGSSDSKDYGGSGKPKKGKKPKKRDWEKKEDKEKKDYKAKKDDKYKKKEKKDRRERDEDRDDEGATREVNVEGKTAKDLVAEDKKAPAQAVGRGGDVAAGTATGVSAPEIKTPEKESEKEKAPTAAEPSEPTPEEVVVPMEEVPPAPTVAGSMAGPVAEVETKVVPEEDAPPAGTAVPGVEGLEATAPEATAESTTPEREVALEEESVKPDESAKFVEPAESKVEQESAVLNEANPSTPTSVMGGVTKEPRPAEPEESKVEQESAVVNPPAEATEAQPEVVKIAPEDEIKLSRRSEEVATKAEEPEAPQYTGPIDFYKLIASTPLPYANPHHLGRPAAPTPPPKGASPPSPPASSPPPSTSAPPAIEQTHTSHSAPTAFPTTTTHPKSQTITFASTRLNTPVTSGEKEKQGTVVGGVKVPLKPEEPDNCCMSGCVNCVWDLYREELEYYTAQKLLAQQTLLLQQSQFPITPATPTTATLKLPRFSQGALNTSTSMDDSGVHVGVDESEWLENEDIPVGIRAFMATEKRLRERKKERKEVQAGI